MLLKFVRRQNIVAAPNIKDTESLERVLTAESFLLTLYESCLGGEGVRPPGGAQYDHHLLRREAGFFRTHREGKVQRDRSEKHQDIIKRLCC